MWIDAKQPPSVPAPQYDGEICESGPVLVCDDRGSMFVAKRTKWEDSPAKWVTDCSEGWDVDDDRIVAWMPLPSLPRQYNTQKD